MLIILAVNRQLKIFPYSFVRSVSRSILRTCCGPETLPGPGDIRENETHSFQSSETGGENGSHRSDTNELPHIKLLVDQTPAGTLMASTTLEARCMFPCHRLLSREALSLVARLAAGTQQNGSVIVDVLSRAPYFCSSCQFFRTAKHVLCSLVRCKELLA